MNRSEKGSIYRIYSRIDLDALKHNVDRIKQCKSKNAMLMGVVKAGAYGHGADVLAHELETMGFDWFAVATADEGIELRNSGVEKPILVLGYCDALQYPELIEWDITPTIYSYEMAEALNQVAKAAGKVVNIHIKIDTGMGRIGFLVEDQTIESIRMINAMENIHIQGLFTHFACADMMDKKHVEQQIEKFHWIIEELDKVGVSAEICHCSNSASIMELPSEHMNMVRAGIILYGLYPSDEVDKNSLDLRPVMSLYSHVVHLKEVAEGVSIGYGATYVTKKATRVATIPVGYADGYPRSLSNKASVLIRGQRAPIIGRICMDQFMVDVTDIEDVAMGDVVTLVGNDGDEILSVEEVAEMAGSFNYEFICDVSWRVPRVYCKNGSVIRIVNNLR